MTALAFACARRGKVLCEMSLKKQYSHMKVTNAAPAKITGIRCDSCDSDIMQMTGAVVRNKTHFNQYECPVCKNTKETMG